MESKTIPDEFQGIFSGLVQQIQPRPLGAHAVNAYWDRLRSLPMAAIKKAAMSFRHEVAFPTANEWFSAAQYLATWTPPAPGSRRLEELDDYAPNDRERDEISKGLSEEDGDELMRRYGYTKVGTKWVHADDLPKVKP